MFCTWSCSLGLRENRQWSWVDFRKSGRRNLSQRLGIYYSVGFVKLTPQQYVPTAACCSIIANPSSLTIRYPLSKDFPNLPRCNIIRILISTFTDLQLTANDFSGQPAVPIQLPGMSLRLQGNVANMIRPRLSYDGKSLHGWRYYVLDYDIPESLLEGDHVPELVLGLEKTAVEQKPALDGTKMPFRQPRPSAKFVTNNPEILPLERLPHVELRIEEAERLISVMREGLLNLKDKTGDFLYTCENSKLNIPVIID